jgi:16S rRNA (uracil1498-N3)-methyltransferase
MHRFYLSNSETKDSQLTLAGSEWHHCQNVLRSEKGTRVTLFDGRGTEYLCEITDANASQARLRILQKTQTPPPPYNISIAQALPKNKVMDFIIQKATELGVQAIVPVLSERATIKLEEEDAKSKLERWTEISIEAAKQCGLNWLPIISKPKSVKQVIESRSQFKLGFIGSLQPDAKPLWSYLPDFKSSKDSVLMMIGPEGDFTPAEIGLVRSGGFQPLSLGPLVLRCDTAAVYSLSTLSYEIRRLGESLQK